MNNGESSCHRFISENESNFYETLVMYRDGLIFFINRFIQNITISEDLAADVFAELIVNKSKYLKGKASLKTYLYMIGRSRALDFLRREKKRQEISVEEVTCNINSEESLEEKIIKEEKLRTFNKILNELPEDYKTILHIIYYDEMSYKDAARIMHKSEKQINNLVYRAKIALRNKIEKENLL